MIRAIPRQGHEGEAQPCGLRLNSFGGVTRCTIPDDHSRRGERSQPGSQMVQELDRIVAVAAAFVPDEALPVGEVIGAIPVDPVLQAGECCLLYTSRCV